MAMCIISVCNVNCMGIAKIFKCLDRAVVAAEAVQYAEVGTKAAARALYGAQIHEAKEELRRVGKDASPAQKHKTNIDYKNIMPWAHDEDSENVFPGC